MENNLKTMLVTGDCPRSIGYAMVCKLLDAGYKVKSTKAYVQAIDDKLTEPLSQMDFLGGIQLLKENENFFEVECDLEIKDTFHKDFSGCNSVVCLYEQLSQNTLKQVAEVSKACGVNRLLLVSFSQKPDDKKDTGCYTALKDHFKQLAEGKFVIFMVRLRTGINDLDMTTIADHIIDENKSKLFGRDFKNVQKVIMDLCLFFVGNFETIHNKNWFSRWIDRLFLENFYFGRYWFDFLRNPRFPFLKRIMFLGLTIQRLFDVSMMMFLLQVWPEQVYRFSTRKLLPNKAERFNAKDRPVIPFELIGSRTSEIKKTEQINVVMRGQSFNILDLEKLEGPIYLVNFNSPIKTQKGVIYIEQCIRQANMMQQLGLTVWHIEVNRVAENGKTFFPDSYLNLSWYEKLLDKPNFKRIAIAEKICRPFKLPLTPSWRPAGAGLNAICALSYFADKINIYGWDFYFKSSPNDMTYWELFSNLNNIKLDVLRSRLHFECALINLYYGYHFSKLSNISIHGYMGQLNKHEKLIKKIERVLFN